MVKKRVIVFSLTKIEIHKIRPQGTKNGDVFVKCLPKTSGKRSPKSQHLPEWFREIISDMTDAEGLSPQSSYPVIFKRFRNFYMEQKHILNLFCKCNDVVDVAVVEASEGSKW